MVTLYKAQVPWSGIQTKYYSDGSIAKSKVTGVFTGVSINEIAVQYGREVSLTTEEEIYGVETSMRGREQIPEDKKESIDYSPEVAIVYRMVASKRTFFSVENSQVKDEGIRVWEVDSRVTTTILMYKTDYQDFFK